MRVYLMSFARTLSSVLAKGGLLYSYDKYDPVVWLFY